MPQKERSQFKAGLFIIISVLLIFCVVVAIKGVKAVFTPVDERSVRFTLSDDVGGLRIGDDVRIGGFKVGVVRRIDLHGLDDKEEPSLIVSFSLPRQYPLHANAHIAIQTTVTGTSVLNIDNIGSGDMLSADTELTGHPSALSALVASLGGAGGDVMDILHDVKSKTLPKLANAADHASDTLTSIHGLSENANGVLGESKTDLHGTFANINVITSDVKQKLPALLEHADGVIVRATTALDNARGTLEDLRVTVGNARDITNTARNIISGNRGKLENIILGLKATSDNLKGASAEIRRSPWRVLYRPAPGEMDNLELYDAARQFADGASNMNDAATSLHDAVSNPNVDKAQVQKMIDQLNATFNNFNVVEQKLWTTVKPE